MDKVWALLPAGLLFQVIGVGEPAALLRTLVNVSIFTGPFPFLKWFSFSKEDPYCPPPPWQGHTNILAVGQGEG